MFDPLITGMKVADLGKATVDIAKCLPKSYSDIKFEATEAIFMQLAQNENIPISDRIAIVSELEKVIKHYKNKKTIIEIADKYLSTADINNAHSVDEDWFDLFLEECKTISNKDIQEIWGKILAEECQNPNSISTKFLFTLKTLDKTSAEAFQKINNLTLQIVSQNETISDRFFLYFNNPLSNLLLQKDLLVLKENGLIDFSEFGYNSYYFENEEYVYLKYFDTKIKIYLKDYNEYKNEHKLFLGNVRYTDNGTKLSKIITRIKQERYIDYFVGNLSKQYYIEC